MLNAPLKTKAMLTLFAMLLMAPLGHSAAQLPVQETRLPQHSIVPNGVDLWLVNDVIAVYGERNCSSNRRNSFKSVSVNDQSTSSSSDIERATFSSDGKHVAFKIEKNGKSYIMPDGKQSAAYNSIGFLTWSDDGKHLAYIVKQGNKFLVVRDGKEGAAYDEIKEVAFSPDSNHLGYLARQGQQWLAVLNETTTQPYSHILNPRGKENGALDFFAVRQEQIYRVTATPK